VHLQLILEEVQTWPTTGAGPRWGTPLREIVPKNRNNAPFTVAALRALGVLVAERENVNKSRQGRPSYRDPDFDAEEWTALNLAIEERFPGEFSVEEVVDVD
jgi:hypothetical protein